MSRFKESFMGFNCVTRWYLSDYKTSSFHPAIEVQYIVAVLGKDFGSPGTSLTLVAVYSNRAIQTEYIECFLLESFMVNIQVMSLGQMALVIFVFRTDIDKLNRTKSCNTFELACSYCRDIAVCAYTTDDSEQT